MIYLCKVKKKYIIKKITLKKFLKFDEIFMCNSIFGIWPVIKISKKNFSFGKKTKEIIDLFLTKYPNFF